MKPLTHLLVDFENLQPTASDITLVRGEEFRLWIFRGPHQNKYDAAMAEAWQPLGQQVDFVRSSKSGKNALDFHISFCLGRLYEQCAAARRPARFVVVSKDGGFDALFEYMATSLTASVGKAPSIPEALALAERLHPALLPATSDKSPTTAVAAKTRGNANAQAPVLAITAEKSSATAASSKTQLDHAAKVVADLRLHPKNRPGKRKTLERHVVSLLGNGATEELGRAVIAELEGRGIIKFSAKSVEYRIPKAK